MRNFKLVLSYDGRRYSGWQKQGNTTNTIQTMLEAALSFLLEQPVEVHGSGRTDAGVHARQQVCSFHAVTALSCEALLDKLRRQLPEDIGAESLEEAEPRFHARLNCREKTYLYRVWNSPAPCVFERSYVYRVPEPLDREAMERAAALLVGEQDFRSFCSNRQMKKSTVRDLRSLCIEQHGEELCFWYTGDGFLMNMVRILTGTLLEIGLGKRQPEEIPAILEAKDRSAAGFTAPAQGLILWEVRY